MRQTPYLGELDPVYLLTLATLLLVLVLAGYTELKDNRIPNWITIPGLLIGFVAGYMPGGLTLQASVYGFLVGFFFLFVFYMFGGMGGGDVKLMGAVGALQGYPLVLNTLVYTALLGGVMGLIVLVWQRNLWHGLVQSLAMLFRRKKPPEEETEEAEVRMGSVPYGVAIILGTLLTLFLTGRYGGM